MPDSHWHGPDGPERSAARPRASRRTFLQAGLAVLGWLAGPWPARAAAGPDAAPDIAPGTASGTLPGGDFAAAFAATSARDALVSLYGDAQIETSAAISLTVPSRVDNGANVPVAVATTLDGVRSIALVAERNPRPLAALYEIPAATRPDIACRIKLAESGRLLAVLDTASGIFNVAAEVTVTQGGCA